MTRVRTVLANEATGQLYVTDPATGKPVPLQDPTTGGPLKRRPMQLSAETGCLYLVDPSTGQRAWVIDPVTGGPLMVAEPEPSQAEAGPAKDTEGVGGAGEETSAGVDPAASQPRRGPGGRRVPAWVIAIVMLAVVGVAVAFLLRFLVGVEQSQESAPVTDSAGNAQGGFDGMRLGQDMQLPSGLTVNVGAVRNASETEGAGGSAVSAVTVTYANGGSTPVTYSYSEWMAQDSEGARYSADGSADVENPLGAGSLAPGETVTGVVCFDCDAAKVYYFGSDASYDISWRV